MRMLTKKRVKRSAFILILIGWGITLYNNQELREKNKLLTQLTDIQKTWCTGLQQVNSVCEKTLVDVSVRLGLDRDLMPLVTTALWRREMKPVTVAKARKKLDAPKVSKGMLKAGEAIGGFDEPTK